MTEGSAADLSMLAMVEAGAISRPASAAAEETIKRERDNTARDYRERFFRALSVCVGDLTPVLGLTLCYG
jgi:hypothetical protein